MVKRGVDKAWIGRKSAPLEVEVERGHIRRFAEAIGDDNPVYRSVAAARSAGLRDVPAPPTFATALRPNDVREGLGIDLAKILHGEEAYELARPLVAGDRLTLVQEIKDVYEKTGKSGTMGFLVMETRAVDADGAVAFVARRTVVVRS